MRSRKKPRPGPVQAAGQGRHNSTPVVSPPEAMGRRRRFRLRVAALLAPLCLVLGTEAGLRLAGWGYPTGFFLKKKENGKAVVRDNPRFGWRFFPPEAARTPQPLSFTAEKPPGSVRVFVFGESAAM